MTGTPPYWVRAGAAAGGGLAYHDGDAVLLTDLFKPGTCNELKKPPLATHDEEGLQSEG
jgi:hypothetical protein